MSNNIKPLPRRDDGSFKASFIANEVEYKIRSSDEGISIARFNEFQKMSLMLGFGANFQKLYEKLNEAIKLTNGVVTNENTFTDLALHLNAMREGIMQGSEERNNIALYICTLFIVREYEDLTKWSMEEAKDKIDDWNKEGYSAEDFFFLALSSVVGFKNVYLELIEQLKEKTLSLQDLFTGDGSFPQMETE